MIRQFFAATTTAVAIMSLISPVVAQDQAAPPSATHNGSLRNVRPVAQGNQGTGMQVAKGANMPSDQKQEARGSSAPPRASIGNEINTQIRSISDRIDAMSNIVDSACAKLDKLQRKPDPHIPPPPSSVPAWIAAGAGLLAVGVICIVLPVLLGLKRQNKAIFDRIQQNGNGAKDIITSLTAVETAVADLPKALLMQVKQLMDAVQKIDGKIGKFERGASDIPRQFDAVAKTISRDAESHRGSILTWLFGRGKTQAPENGFVQQIEDRIEKFQAIVLSAVESDHKLQSRKLELDERERKLSERANALDAECDKARCEGEAEAKRRAIALESANKVLAENMNSRSVEFGKRIATLEGEMNAAKVAAQQAKSECAVAKSQADAAVKLRDKLSEEVSRLSSEVAKRDQARDAEIANAREEIKTRIEKASAEEMANLRAEAKIARDERDVAKRATEDLQAQKSAVDAALVAARASLDAEKVARENDRTAAERELATERAARESDRKMAEEKLAELVHERDAAVARVFPEEFHDDPDFQPLLSMLDEWDARGVPGSALARASLSIFADRKNLPPKIWQRALGDLSLGLAAAMNAEKRSPAEAADVLGKWKAAVQKRASEGPSFSLNLPLIGAQVDTSWMHAKPGAAKVSRIGSWAVYGQSGNVYMAEVE